MVLLALLAAVMLPRFANSTLASAQGEACASDVANALKLARRLAVANGAVNAQGYAVVGTATSYRILNLSTGTYTPVTALAQGWQFENSGYAVYLDPYGGARGLPGLPTYLAVYKGGVRWLINFEPATGYVWYGKG